jgi:glycerol-3-phosphate acyltransferase PlsY
MELFFIVSISYLMGSIPFGYIFTKIFLKKDIRDIGSGNIGATNALRTGNKLLGYSTLIFDVLKAVVPILIIKFNYPEFIFLSSLLIFVGHVFPVWLNFKGGKGIAVYVGILFSLNYILVLIFAFFWFVILVIFRFSSLSSLTASLIIPFYQFLFIDNNNYYFYIIMFILIFYTHRENIKRLINNTESKTEIY